MRFGNFRRLTIESAPWKTASTVSAFARNQKPDESIGKVTCVVFTMVTDLKRKLMRIRQYNEAPLKWKYADPSRHISTQSVGTGH